MSTGMYNPHSISASPAMMTPTCHHIPHRWNMSHWRRFSLTPFMASIIFILVSICKGNNSFCHGGPSCPSVPPPFEPPMVPFSFPSRPTLIETGLETPPHHSVWLKAVSLCAGVYLCVFLCSCVGQYLCRKTRAKKTGREQELWR